MREAASILIQLACLAIVIAAGTLETVVLAHAAILIAAGTATRSAGHRDSRSAAIVDIAGDEPSLRRRDIVAIVSVISLLLAAALVSALAGSTSLSTIERTLQESYVPERSELSVGEGSLLGVAAIVLSLTGCAASFGLFPLNACMQNCFEGSPAGRTALTAILLRSFSGIVIWKLLVVALPGFESTTRVCCVVLGGSSCLAGAILACRSESLRSLAGNLWLSWGGITVISIAAATGQIIPDGTHDGQQFLTAIETALVCLVTSSLAITMIMKCERCLSTEDRRVDFEEDLTGLGTVQPAAAAAVTCALLTLCGIPPLPGFWSISLVAGTAFQPGLEASQGPSLVPDYSLLAAFATVVLSMVVLAARSVRLLSLMYHHQPVRQISLRTFRGTKPLLVAACLLLVWLGIFPGRLFALIQWLPL